MNLKKKILRVKIDLLLAYIEELKIKIESIKEKIEIRKSELNKSKKLEELEIKIRLYDERNRNLATRDLDLKSKYSTVNFK